MAVAICCSLALVWGRSFAAERLPLQQLAAVPLPGAATRFDYESLDSQRGMLFIAHLAASEIVVFDVKRNRVVGTIPAIDRVHGVLAVPELGRVYATATGSNEVAVIDAKTLRVIARVPAGTYPDGMAYDPDDRKLYVSDEHGDTETVIDTTANTRVATIPLGGDVGNSQYDARTHRIFVNVEDGELVAIDPKRDQIVARYGVPGCKSNHGLLIDDEHRKAYIACEENATLVVFDLRRLTAGQAIPIGEDPDVLAYDVREAMLYVASESGTVSIFVAGSGSLKKISQGFFATNAHIVGVDQNSHRVYFPVLGEGGPKLLIVKPTATRSQPHPAHP